MSSITVELPENLREYVNNRIADSGYGDPGQYLLDLIRADRQIRHELEPYTSGAAIDQLLLEGLASGDLGPMSPDDWERLKAPFRNQQDKPETP